MPLFHTPRAEGFDVKQPLLTISPGKNSFLGDVYTSEAPEDKQISCGFYEQAAGEALEYFYDYDEMKVVLEVKAEHFYISDGEKKIDAKEGDVFYFKKGTNIKFEVVGPEGSYAKNFFTGLRPADAA